MTPNRRSIALAAAALIAGIAIGWNDSRPTWDDTGITAGLLVVAGAVFGVVDARRWWIWALLIGLGTPLFEISWRGRHGVAGGVRVQRSGAAGGAGASRSLRSDRRERGARLGSAAPAPVDGRDDGGALAEEDR